MNPYKWRFTSNYKMFSQTNNDKPYSYVCFIVIKFQYLASIVHVYIYLASIVHVYIYQASIAFVYKEVKNLERKFCTDILHKIK